MAKLDALWQYQAAELEKERLEREILRSPAHAKLHKLYAFLTEQQNAISRMQAEMEQKQASLAKLAERVQKLEKDVDLEASEFEQMQKDEECTAAELTECRRSYEQLLEALAAARRELTELVKWTQNIAAEYKDTRGKAGKAKKEYDATRAACEAEQAARQGEVDEAAAAMNDKAKAVDAPLMERYKKVKKNHAVPMAKVENDQCSGCNMSLPTVVIKKVTAGTGIVECDNCGRILYAGNV